MPPVCAARQAQLAEPARLAPKARRESLVQLAHRAQQVQRVLLVRPAQLESLAQLAHRAQQESLAQLEHKAPPAQPGQPELKVRLDQLVRLVRQEPRVRWVPLALRVQQVR